MSKIKSLALKLPYPLLNAGRLVRGEIRKNRARNLNLNSCAIEDIAEGVKRGFISKSNFSDALRGRKIEGENIIRWATAFENYRGERTQQMIKLLWADGPAPGNFGDWLSPYIIRQLTGRGIELVDDYAPPKSRHLVAIGSLAPAINSWAHVLGAGAANEKTKMNPLATYHSVRGPYTARALKKSGGRDVQNFGDLGFILSRVYVPKKRKIDANVVLVRHMNHARHPISLPEGVVELSIAAASPEEIEDFIDTIFSVGKVVTSAMHCFIACQSYGIPCALVNFDADANAVYGDGTKYLDAMEGGGVKPQAPLLIPFEFDYRNFESIVYEDQISIKAIDEIERHARTTLGTYLEV